MMRFLPLLPLLCLLSCERQQEAAAPVTKSERRSTTSTEAEQTTAAAEDTAKPSTDEQEKAEHKAYLERIMKMSLVELEAELETLLAESCPNLKSKFSNYRSINTIFERLGEIAPERGIELLSKLSISQQKDAELDLVRAWGKTDFDAAYQYALTSKDGQIDKSSLSRILSGLATTDPTRALAIAQQHECPDAHYGIFRAWIKVDTQQAIDMFAAQEGAGTWERRSFYESALKHNPEVAMAAVQSLNEQDRRAVLKEVIEELYSKSPEKVQAIRARLSDEDAEFLDQQVARKSNQKEAREKPEAIIASVLSGEESNLSHATIAKAFDSGAKKDWNGVWEKAQGILNKELRMEVSKKLLIRRAFTEPSFVIDRLLSNPEYQESLADSHVSFVLGLTNQEQHIEKLMAAPSTEHTQEITGNIYTAWAHFDVEAASAALSAASHSNEPWLGKAYEDIAHDYNTHPTEGLAWIDGIESPAHKDQALRGLATGWAHDNEQAAIDWVNTLPEGNSRDMAVSGIAETLADSGDKQHALGLEWLSTINTPSYRIQRARQSYRRWRHTDSAAAEQWLQSTDLFSPTEKQQLAQ